MLERLELRDKRVFRDAVFGWEILEAARKAKAFSDTGPEPAKIQAIFRGQERGKRQAAGAPVRRLSAKDLRD